MIKWNIKYISILGTSIKGATYKQRIMEMSYGNPNNRSRITDWEAVACFSPSFLSFDQTKLTIPFCCFTPWWTHLVQDPETWVCGGPTSTNPPLTVVTLWSIPSNTQVTPAVFDSMWEILKGLAIQVSGCCLEIREIYIDVLIETDWPFTGKLCWNWALAAPIKVTSTLPPAGWLLAGGGVEPAPWAEQDPVNWVCGGPTSTNSAPLTVVTLWSMPLKVHWIPPVLDEMCEILSGLSGGVRAIPEDWRQM